MATGRDEMLRRNQQRNKKRKAEKTKSSVPKRKGLMEVLDDYRKEQESGPYAKGAVKGKGPVRDGKEYGSMLDKQRAEDKKRGPLVKAPQHDGHKVEAPPPVKPQGSSGEKTGNAVRGETLNGPARQQATRTRAQGAGGGRSGTVNKDKDKDTGNTNKEKLKNLNNLPQATNTPSSKRKPGYYFVKGKGRRYWDGKKFTMTQAGSRYGGTRQALNRVARSLGYTD